MINTEQLNAIKERAAKAMPGPWYHNRHNEISTPNGARLAQSVTGLDAEFIAYAREDVPALVAEVERLNTVKHRLNSEVELYRKQYEGAQIQLCESEDEIARLRKALEYYADEKHYEPYAITDVNPCDITEDGGYIAREALE